MGLSRIGERGRKVGRRLAYEGLDKEEVGDVQCKVRFAITSSGGGEGTR